MKYILNKPPARKDNRTLKLSTILKTELLPPLPATFDLDSNYPGLIDNFMFANDTVGDCVIAEHAHQLLRFAFYQQQKEITITDAEVLAEYYKETGGPDSGLDMLTSLNVWRQTGFPCGGEIYTIDAFASIDWKNHNEVMYGCMLFNGVAVGVQVPQSALDQFDNGQVWTVVPGSPIRGGHAIFEKAYIPLQPTIITANKTGPVFYTWGRPQQATWEWADAQIDEAYVIIDNIESWVNPATDPLNIPLLKQYLSQIGATPSQQITITSLSLPAGHLGKSYMATLNAVGGTSPYTWVLQSGILPTGLILTSMGVIQGVPTVAGKSGTLTFICTDSLGNASGIMLTLTVKKPCSFFDLLKEKRATK